MAELIVALAGKQGAGKTSASEYLSANHNFAVLSPSRVIRDYAAEHSIDLDGKRKNYAKVRQLIGKERGPDWIADSALKSESDRVVMDGLRTLGDFYTLKVYDRLKRARVAMIALDCADEARFQHVVKRNDKTKEIPESVEQMLLQEKAENYSSDVFGIATEDVMKQIPESMTISFSTEPEHVVQHMIVALLHRQGIKI